MLTHLATLLDGHFTPPDRAKAILDPAARAKLAALVDASSYTLTGLARAMGRSHTWALRKLDPEAAEPRPCTLADAVEILTFLELPAESMSLAAA